MRHVRTVRVLTCVLLVPLALLGFAIAALAQGDAPPATPPAPGQGDDIFAGATPGEEVIDELRPKILTETFFPTHVVLAPAQPEIPEGSHRVTSTALPEGGLASVADMLTQAEGVERSDQTGGLIAFTLPLEWSAAGIRARAGAGVLGVASGSVYLSLGDPVLPLSYFGPGRTAEAWSDTCADIVPLGQPCAQAIQWPKSDIRCYLESVDADTYRKHELDQVGGFELTATTTVGADGQTVVRLTLTKRVLGQETLDQGLGAYIGAPTVTEVVRQADLVLPKDKVLALLWCGAEEHPAPTALEDVEVVDPGAAPTLETALLVTIEPPGAGGFQYGGAVPGGTVFLRLNPNTEVLQHLDMTRWADLEQPTMPPGPLPEKP
jgi:hypothetical protein